MKYKAMLSLLVVTSILSSSVYAAISLNSRFSLNSSLSSDIDIGDHARFSSEESVRGKLIKEQNRRIILKKY